MDTTADTQVATGRAVRRRLVAGLVAVIGALWLAPGAAAFKVEKWEAGTCKESSCTDAGSSAAFYTQAAGHPSVGITDFEFASQGKSLLGVEGWKEPEGSVKEVRVDLPPGLAVNPEATKNANGELILCTEEELNSDNKECPEASKVGVDKATGTAEIAAGVKQTVTEEFPVYNMEREPGQPSRFGVEIASPTLDLLSLQGHVYLEGGISWHPEAETSENSGVATGDYHQYFTIPNIPRQPEVIESRLIFNGVVDGHAFITLPSTCSSKPVTTLHVDSYEAPSTYLKYTNETPVTATGCDELAFNPTLALSAEDSQSDQPDGVSAELRVPQRTDEPSKPDSPDVRTAEVTLPEGMTLNPSAAHGLEGCSDEQFAGESCPAGSEVGSFAVNAPGIPDGSLTGGVYVGSPKPGKDSESGEEFRIFLYGDAAQYGVGLRLEGAVKANATTGRLTAVFGNAPQVPFESLTLHLRGGKRAPLANPLNCGAAEPSASIDPYGGEVPTTAIASGFVVDGSGAGGSCASPLPFSLTQSLSPQPPARAGAYDPANFSLSRATGQQYLSRISTTLPAGLLGSISSVPLCGEPAAREGSCPAGSLIGTVTVAAGAGEEPYEFTGKAYLTGPYDGAPYGLSVVVPAVAGPYDLGEVKTRAGITVGLYSGRVTVTAELPTIVEGVPLRLQSLNVSVSRPNFLFNPTSCGPLSTESMLGSSFAATQALSSGFQVGDCAVLPFKPRFSAASGGRPTKARGASLVVKITQPAHQANIRELQLQLPKQLPSRLTTLQKACLAASFESSLPPGSCAHTADVGTVSVSTPVLPGALTGPAYLISHGGESFPDLDLVLRGDGLEVVLVGHTHISRTGITTSTFESLPDVPISSVTVDLPIGSDSVLAAHGRLCRTELIAPTTMIAQSGAKITQHTRIAVRGCRIELISHKRHERRVTVSVWTPQAGLLTISGRGVRRVRKRVKKAGKVKISVLLSGHARRHRLRIGFTAKSGHNPSAVSLSVKAR
ncbi:MAG: hypothetical protein ACRDJX_04625 [Solirubrobacteraceae bacterium]